VVATYVAAQLKYPPILQRFKEEWRRALRLLLILDELVFKKHLESPCAVNVNSNLAEVGANSFKYIFQLFFWSLSEELLAEKIRNLVHHQLVESAMPWYLYLAEIECAVLLVKQLSKDIIHELAVLVRWLKFEDFFVNLVLEELETVFVLCE